MTKLEILAAYLPYDINVSWMDAQGNIRKLVGVNTTGMRLKSLNSENFVNIFYSENYDVRPILRPLNQLSEELICELFLLTTNLYEMPENYTLRVNAISAEIEWLDDSDNCLGWAYVFHDQAIISGINVFNLHKFFRILLKNHFDVFNLIEEKQAIELK